MTHVINDGYSSDRAHWVDNAGNHRAVQFIDPKPVTLMDYPHPETISPAQAALLSLYGYTVVKVRLANLGRKPPLEWMVYVKGERSIGPNAKILVVSDTLEQWIAELADWEGRTLTYNGHTVPDPP